MFKAFRISASRPHYVRKVPKQLGTGGYSYTTDKSLALALTPEQADHFIRWCRAVADTAHIVT